MPCPSGAPGLSSSPSRRHTAIINFLRWGSTKGQNYLEPLSYARLPNAVVAQEEKAISRIKSPSSLGGEGVARAGQTERDAARPKQLWKNGRQTRNPVFKASRAARFIKNTIKIRISAPPHAC